MPWVYESSTGNVFYSKGEINSGTLIGKGYSGKKGYKNNIIFDHVKNTGPIPPGMYTVGLPYQSKTKGPITMKLNPFGHNAFNRTDFRIHGNNRKNDASEGCIILAPDLRKRIGGSNDRILLVVRKLSANHLL